MTPTDVPQIEHKTIPTNTPQIEHKTKLTSEQVKLLSELDDRLSAIGSTRLDALSDKITHSNDIELINGPSDE